MCWRSHDDRPAHASRRARGFRGGAAADAALAGFGDDHGRRASPIRPDRPDDRAARPARRAPPPTDRRSDDRRAGKGGVRTGNTSWWRASYKKKKYDELV